MATGSEADAKRSADVNVMVSDGTNVTEDDVFGGMTVKEVVNRGDIGRKLRPSDSLGDLAEVLASSGRTAMVVVSSDDIVLGLVTANDIMRAYFDGISPDKSLNDWLGSGAARAPSDVLQRLVVSPDSKLSVAAEKMVTNAIAGNCACHHAVVEEFEGHPYAVISSHDVVKALCHHDTPWKHKGAAPDMFAAPDAAEIAQTKKVRDVMKNFPRVFTCVPSDSLKTALKTLLVTQQNSVLILDEDGVHGLITVRDAVKAFADVIENTTSISSWQKSHPAHPEERMIASDAELHDAAEQMTKFDVDHLIVVHSRGGEAVGVVSSLDLLLQTRSYLPVLQSMPLWIGPSVAECLQRHRLDEIHSIGVTLAEISDIFLQSGRTSTIVELGGDGPHFGLLTENDIVRAFVDGWAGTATVEAWLASAEYQRTIVPWQLQVPQSMPMLEGASLMLSAAEPGRPCHHLVVTSTTGGWLGVFSALDIARALDAMSSELDIARTGADQATVGMVMKLGATVPQCKPSDSIRDALSALDTFGQNAVMVVDDAGGHSLITPRHAMQAMAEGIPQDCSVAAWLRSHRAADGPREVDRATRLVEAAKIMTQHSLHHLLVMDEPNGKPVGVLSSLDLARGIVSINYNAPFVTLSWLRTFGERTSFAMQAPSSTVTTKSPKKRPTAGLQQL